MERWRLSSESQVEILDNRYVTYIILLKYNIHFVLKFSVLITGQLKFEDLENYRNLNICKKNRGLLK